MIVCQSDGCSSVLQWGGRGRKPRFCEEHKRERDKSRKAGSRELRRAGVACKAPGCDERLSWTGKGAKPKYCTRHKKAAKRIRERKAEFIKDRHAQGRAASRFGELWMSYEYVYDEAEGTTVKRPNPVVREASHVWGATGEDDETVFNRSGVFHATGRDGLPNPGLSIPDNDNYADLVAWLEDRERLARGEIPLDENGELVGELDPRAVEARKWLRENPHWWVFESDDPGRPPGSRADEHNTLSSDITDTVIVHGGEYKDDPDESTPMDRCSWCWSWEPLVLAGEFCSEECMTDFVRTFGPDGRKGL